MTPVRAQYSTAHKRTTLDPLDSPQWFAWLEAPENDGFSYALHNHAKGYIDGFMTVRKERRQRGGAYWTAYRRQGRRLRKIYLGPSASLTAARLREVAARLYSPKTPRRQRRLRKHANHNCTTANCKLQQRHKGGKTCCRPNPNPAALRDQRHPGDASS